LSICLNYDIIYKTGVGNLDEHENLEQQTQEEQKLRQWWHPAFVQGLIAVLDPKEESLGFQDEFRLSKEALRIDVIVTANNGTIPENHAMAQIFNKHNLFEYKAHNDSLTISDYIASIGKGHIYSAFKDIPISDITISFVLTKNPRTVLNYLKDVRKFTVAQKDENSLIYVHGDVFPVQILVCKKDDNIILKNMHDKLTPKEVYETIKVFEKIRSGEKNVYVDRIISANWDAYKEASEMYPTLKERVVELEKEGWFDEIHKARDQARDIEKAKKMLQLDIPAEKIAVAMELPLEMVKSLA